MLDDTNTFPPPELAQRDGLVAIGGDLSPERLLHAYKQGIFPWYESEIILWWSPDPRSVLFPAELNTTRTVKKLIRDHVFDFTINKAFKEVIHHCKNVARPGQGGTWITDEVEKAYIRMHELGYAHSAEVWNNGELVGGLYGMRIGKVFFGESMFSLQSNASRLAMAKYVEQIKTEGVEMIDCQVYTPYLESMGARMIPRDDFMKRLTALT